MDVAVLNNYVNFHRDIVIYSLCDSLVCVDRAVKREKKPASSTHRVKNRIFFKELRFWNVLYAYRALGRSYNFFASRSNSDYVCESLIPFSLSVVWMFNKIQNLTNIEGIKLMFISRNSQLINYISRDVYHFHSIFRKLNLQIYIYIYVDLLASFIYI